MCTPRTVLPRNRLVWTHGGPRRSLTPRSPRSTGGLGVPEARAVVDCRAPAQMRWAKSDGPACSLPLSAASSTWGSQPPDHAARVVQAAPHQDVDLAAAAGPAAHRSG